MNLRQLQYFRELAKIEHITQAAEKLSITQPSLSHAISELEKELGTFLFEKQGRNIRLTKYGKYFLTYVDNALEELEKGQKNLRELTSPGHGRIDLAFIYTLGAEIVPNMIKAFVSNEEHKDISFSFHQGTTKSLVSRLKEDRYDLAFCSFVENEPEIEFTPLVQQELVLVVPHDHPLATQDSIDLKDTAPYPFILYSKKSGLRPIIDGLFTKVNITPNMICEVVEDSAIAGLVSINYGIAVMPRITSLNFFNVKVLPISSPANYRFIYIASVKNRYLSPAASLFRNFAIQYANDFYL
jgi:DNA-binding transcriptional LysR family regulator